MEISPATLHFSGPFAYTHVKREIHLKNNTEIPIAYKVKTTAPRLYCVRPNASAVSAGQEVDIAVILQGLREEPELGSRSKDKFLIQTIPYPKEFQEQPIAEFWQYAEANLRSEIKDFKIRVAFDQADSSTANGSATINKESNKSIADSSKSTTTAPSLTPVRNQHQHHHTSESESNNLLRSDSTAGVGSGSTKASQGLNTPSKEANDTINSFNTPISNQSDVANELHESVKKSNSIGKSLSGKIQTSTSSASQDGSHDSRSSFSSPTSSSPVTSQGVSSGFDAHRSNAVKRSGSSKVSNGGANYASEESALSDAKKEIALLERKLLNATAANESVNGVSLPIVMILCFTSFILAWLFF